MNDHDLVSFAHLQVYMTKTGYMWPISGLAQFWN